MQTPAPMVEYRRVDRKVDCLQKILQVRFHMVFFKYYKILQQADVKRQGRIFRPPSDTPQIHDLELIRSQDIGWAESGRHICDEYVDIFRGWTGPVDLCDEDVPNEAPGNVNINIVWQRLLQKIQGLLRVCVAQETTDL